MNKAKQLLNFICVNEQYNIINFEELPNNIKKIMNQILRYMGNIKKEVMFNKEIGVYIINLDLKGRYEFHNKLLKELVNLKSFNSISLDSKKLQFFFSI